MVFYDLTNIIVEIIIAKYVKIDDNYYCVYIHYIQISKKNN